MLIYKIYSIIHEPLPTLQKSKMMQDIRVATLKRTAIVTNNPAVTCGILLALITTAIVVLGVTLKYGKYKKYSKHKTDYQLTQEPQPEDVRENTPPSECLDDTSRNHNEADQCRC